MAQVHVRFGGRRVWVVRPNGREYGHLALEIVMTLAQARADGSDVFFVRPPYVINSALLDLESDEVRHLSPGRLSRAWLSTRWRVGHTVERARARREETASSARTELARELTRHISNAKLPRSLRERLRQSRQRMLQHADGSDEASTGALYYRRRLIRQPVRVDFPHDKREAAERAAAEIGIEPGARIVAVHAREGGFKRGREVHDLKSGRRDDSARNARIQTYFDAIDQLVADGYRVVRIGDPSMAPVTRRGLIDLATHPLRTAALEVLTLLRSEFLVCGDAGPHAVSYLTNTPCLIVNASEPICSFPVRSTGLFIFKKVIDLDTGRPLDLQSMLSEEHYRNLRNTSVFGYRDNTRGEIVEAVGEMRRGLARGWTETDEQRRYRLLVTEAGERLAARVRYLHKWGPDGGFIGDGRVADFYARRYV